MSYVYDNPRDRYDRRTIRGRQRLEEKEREERMWDTDPGTNYGVLFLIAGFLVLCVIWFVVNVLVPLALLAAAVFGIVFAVRYLLNRRKSGGSQESVKHDILADDEPPLEVD